MKVKRLKEINQAMLCRGEPSQVDTLGYAKYDYDFGWYVSISDAELTPSEEYKLVKTLLKYKNTQLPEIATAEEIAELQNRVAKLEEKAMLVNIIRFEKTSVTLSWSWNQKVSDFIRTLNRQEYQWKKSTIWEFTIKWATLPQLLPVFIENGFNVKQVMLLKTLLENGEELPIEFLDLMVKAIDKKAACVPVKNLRMVVARSTKQPDVLNVGFTHYSKESVEIVGKLEHAFWNGYEKTWNIYIEDAATLYKLFTLSGIEINMKALEPWKALVESWEKTYEWNGKQNKFFQPYAYQVDDIKQFLEKKCLINGNEMGCGKTYEGVAVMTSVEGRKLVICPESLRLVWKSELLNVEPNADVQVLYNSDTFEDREYTIIGYSSLKSHLKELESKPFDVVIIDEAHALQAISSSGQPDSQRAQAALRLCATAHYVIPTTGTPKTSRNKNLYNILRAVRHPLTRGRTAWYDYGKRYCDGYQDSFGWNFDGNSNDEELFQELNPYMVRHLKKDVLPDLKKQRHAIPVNVDLTEYSFIIREYLQNRKNKSAEQLARLTRARRLLANQKSGETIDLTRDFIKNGEKVIIATNFTESAELFKRAFEGNVVWITGGMTDVAKAEAIEAFQNGEPMVCVLNVKAGGVGITLTKAHIVIMNDMPWTPGEAVQVEDRASRTGQTELLHVYYPYAVGADMDEYMANLLTYKSATINQAIDNGENEQIELADSVIGFKSLMDGETREEKKLRKATELAEIKRTKELTKQAAKTAKKADIKKLDTKSYTVEELEQLVRDSGQELPKVSDPRIYRMRLTMLVKKIG